MSPRFDDIKRPPIWRRLVVGAVLVVFATAAATAIAAVREFRQIGDAIIGPDIPVGRGTVTPPKPGKPQTILLLGSDRRPQDGGAGARSDTLILARLDPGHAGTSLLSLPRDLRVRIPGHGVGKINAAYEAGGPELTVRTVRALTGLEINHVVNVDFGGFERAINALGCVYVDVDRRYFNASAEYAAIDVPQGFQRLCGQKALQFARFRHEDTDLIRGARQQTVIAAIKQRAGVGDLLDRRHELERIFGRSTTTDASFKEPKTLIGLTKLGLLSAGRPIRQVQFAGDVGITAGDSAAGRQSFVTVSRATMRHLVGEFVGAPARRAPDRRPPSSGPRRPPASGLVAAEAAGKEQALAAIRAGAGGRLPVWYPQRLTRDAQFAGPPRVYRIRTGGRNSALSYRMVVKRGSLGEFYGVQGTTWRNPPLLEGGSDKVTVGRRTFELHYDGDRVKLVAWRTSKGVYWVSNTLLQSLTKSQMLTIARTTRLP